MFSHLTVGSNDIARAKAFYEAVMAPLGHARVIDGDDYFAYGETAASPPSFWVLPPFDGRPAERGNGWHCAFLAPSRGGGRRLPCRGARRRRQRRGRAGPAPTLFGHLLRCLRARPGRQQVAGRLLSPGMTGP